MKEKNKMPKFAIKPAFSKNNLGIIFSADQNYVPYLAVSIQSIFDHADDRYNYDILVFDDGITDYQKTMLAGMAKANCSIRYINVRDLLKDFDTTLFQARGIWSVATFYRLFIPEIMPDYQKVLYLDCDILVRDSLVDIFNLDLGNSQIACVYDCIRYMKQKNRIKDCEQTLGLKDYRLYFNAGVIMFNLQKIDGREFKERFLAILTAYTLPFLDQDILNIIFEGKCYFLPPEWNYQYHILLGNIDLKEIPELNTADKNPKIIHYTACKPWSHPELPHVAEWWSIARRLAFYEEIIFKNTKISSQLLCNLIKYKRLAVKYRLYKVLRNITFGETCRRISQTCSKMQNQVKAVRNILKQK